MNGQQKEKNQGVLAAHSPINLYDNPKLTRYTDYDDSK